VASLRRPNQDPIELTGSILTIGRDPSNDLCLSDDRLVSRAHAQIALQGEQWMLIDLNSRNGTRANGRTIRQHPLRHGDLIGIGGSELAFVMEGDPQATESALPTPSVTSLVQLTERERAVLRLVSDGLTDKAVADRLFISANTVRSHLERIGEKTGLRRRSELTRLAIEMGLDD
jgi:pSer/pThr/pTyr-binding forkhead associated (FHA) protein